MRRLDPGRSHLAYSLANSCSHFAVSRWVLNHRHAVGFVLANPPILSVEDELTRRGSFHHRPRRRDRLPLFVEALRLFALLLDGPASLDGIDVKSLCHGSDFFKCSCSQRSHSRAAQDRLNGMIC